MSKLTILDYYLEQSKNPNYLEEFRSTSDLKSGKTFWHINVNFRSLNSFIDTFSKFEKYDSKDRSTWDVYSNKEQKAKHWTVRMQQSKLFRRFKGIYVRTAKGEAFADFVNITKDPQFHLTDNEKWIILYYFMLNSYFNLKPNYIIKRSLEVFDILLSNNFTIQYLKQSFIELLKKGEDISREELFKLDAFWIITFAKDNDFLSLYQSASISEKEDLFKYVIAASKGTKDEIKNRNDLISWKYVSGGQYLPSTFYDDVKTLFITYFSTRLNNPDPYTFLNNICEIHGYFSEINSKKIKEFVTLHIDIFETIFNEAILNKTIDSTLNDIEEGLSENESVEDINENKVDDTTTKSNQQLRKTSQILKRIAKERANNKCELEMLNSCKYFTSKESGNNYLEIHHLIPFEFSNDFENSLEVIENYIALCPHCHRLLHFGVDRERIAALSFLYNLRKDALAKKGLNITLKELLAYYGVDE